MLKIPSYCMLQVILWLPWHFPVLYKGVFDLISSKKLVLRTFVLNKSIKRDFPKILNYLMWFQMPACKEI